MKAYVSQLLSILLCLPVALVFAQGQETPPDEVAKRCNQHGEVPIKYNGRWNCMRCAEITYTDPKTGYAGCCHLDEKFVVDKAHPKEGDCCKAGQIYSYDPTTSKGACCTSGQAFKNGQCTPQTDPSPRCPACTNEYACACDGDLGIQYGHCYTMTDVNGLHLNRDVAGIYQSGGDIDNLIFKVCESTDDCDKDKDQYVPDDGTWYLQDQLGSRVGKGPGWFGNLSPHMGIVESDRTDLAAQFKGEGFCMYGDCAICLRLPDKGLSSPCPMGVISEKAHIGPSINPNNCKAYRFQEVKCVKDVPAKVKA